MPLIHESYDSLPYVDSAPTAAALAAAQALVAADITTASVDTDTLHPALAPAAVYVPRFSDAMEQEHARLQADPASKLDAIDMKRYDNLDAPENTSPTSDEDKPELLAQWKDVLERAYMSSEYVQARRTELNLLERFGKNMWLVGNSQQEDILKRLEAELADVRRQQEDVEGVRRAQQDNIRREMEILQEGWKRGVGDVLVVEVAAEKLKQEILEKKRTAVAA
ncbi:hypothetical protein P154DRAFT_541335 [Amniculicola lignicola CBS 123094]|uniref:BCAS2 family protein n=1 Tax=Amniculicola lignicola CBS 123094 TaxID=1392246 RepID=A0A6A5X5D6_9PLEO|nr:hypothetical protein P154DRAFT_541335 [Amniculicola lignicola CBS 123094]